MIMLIVVVVVEIRMAMVIILGMLQMILPVGERVLVALVEMGKPMVEMGHCI